MKKVISLFFMIFLLIVVVACNNHKSTTDELLLLVEGNWIADGTQYNPIIAVVGDEVTHAVNPDDLTPYTLSFDGIGNYILITHDQTYNGTYSVDDNGFVNLIDDVLLSVFCQLEKDNELHCDRVASIFIKE